MVDISVSPGVGFMQIVEKRDAETLLPIILAHTRPGITIILISGRHTATFRDAFPPLPFTELSTTAGIS
jgi:hypothetical protein